VRLLDFLLIQDAYMTEVRVAQVEPGHRADMGATVELLVREAMYFFLTSGAPPCPQQVTRLLHLPEHPARAVRAV